MDSYRWAHEDENYLPIKIEWSIPATHDMLHSGLVDSNETAYFYAIVGRFDGEWWAYYIGMVYYQQISTRHKNQDHIMRLNELKNNYPDTTWHITLGTPTIEGKRISENLIKQVEGLLIYSHWHDESINKKRVNEFFSNKYISIENVGFIDPFYPKIGFGVFVAEQE